MHRNECALFTQIYEFEKSNQLDQHRYLAILVFGRPCDDATT